MARRARTVELLEAADRLVNSVDYEVSVRWMFYQLLQLGFYSDKKPDYKRWVSLSSSVRKSGEMGWDWDTFVDDGRSATIRGDGWGTPRSYFESMARYAGVSLDIWTTQDRYVEIWFEAQAMFRQFEHIAPDFVTLAPMGGQPSLYYKDTIAQRLALKYEEYSGEKSLHVLYFGDLDEGGTNIWRTVSNEIPERAGVPVDVTYCGLTEEQVRRWRIPENINKPGAYQWEALSDAGARSIIGGSLGGLVDMDRVRERRLLEGEATEKLREALLGVEVG